MSATAAKLVPNITTPTPGQVRIVLEDSDRIPPTGQYFGINGKGFMLRAGEAANVPSGIIDILDNAIETHPIRDANHRVVGYRNRHRFPYRVLRSSDED